MSMKRHVIGLLAGGAIAALLLPQAGFAQAAPAARQAGRHRFDIPAGPLTAALNAWSRQSGRSILFPPDLIAGARTRGVKGTMEDNDALDALLAGQGLTRYDDASGAVAIAVADAAAGNAGNAIPDILVQGRRSWSLNTGIERTQDDSQPFIVMTREEIQRSGAPNLESFLRDRLNVSASPGTSEQAKGGGTGTDPNRGTSAINLRGLGVRDTLILVDGRRQPGVNAGYGTLTQASITGIPLASIERIEVLASSASGIYGSGASGGVINIVLKRDYTGGEISSTYADTGDFKQGQGQIDLTYGVPLEGGRTRLSFAGSWRKSDPLLFGDRYDLARRGIDTLLANAPSAIAGSFALPPNANTPNFNAPGAAALTLKPQYGGGTLPARFGSVPAGYRGIAIDGIAPLIAGVGKYNYEPADSAVRLGTRAPLLYGSESISGTLSVRREFSDRLTGYAGLTLGKSTSESIVSRGLDIVNLSRLSPANPFNQDITISVPIADNDVAIRNEQQTISLIGGFIAKLGDGWQAVFDLSYSHGRFQRDTTPPTVSDATVRSVASGVQTVLKDTVAYPLAITYADTPFYTAQTPSPSATFNPSLRIAGPVPVTLPGGRPQMTLNVEYSNDWIGATTSANIVETFTTATYNPAAKQEIWSAYGEIALPLIGKDQHIPLLRELELRVSARAEKYRGDGFDPINCGLEGEAIRTPFESCPPAGAVPRNAVTQKSRIDPSYSARWMPFDFLALRGSYTTGYLPPTLRQLVRIASQDISIFAGDPLRGYESIGSESVFGYTVTGFVGGNPDVKPETSKTFSGGAIFTPAFIPGFRASADWTRIRKRNVYFDPRQVAFAFDESFQQSFDAFLAANPDRVTRAPASDGYSVGRITSIDLSLVNLLSLATDAVDFVVDYNRPLLGGTFSLTGRATYVAKLEVEPFPAQPKVDYAGVVSQGFAQGVVTSGNGSLRWRGSTFVNWSKDALTLGYQARYFGRYALNAARAVDVAQGSAYVPAQLYHDISASYRFGFGATLKAGINNVFGKHPPFDSTAAALYYSPYGDPRLRNGYLGISKTF